jgi:hypothetical protein
VATIGASAGYCAARWLLGLVWHQADLGVERSVANEGWVGSGVEAISAILWIHHRNKRF